MSYKGLDWERLAAIPPMDLSKLDHEPRDAASLISDFDNFISTAKFQAARQAGLSTKDWQAMAELLAYPQLNTFLQTVQPSTLQSSCVLDLLVLQLNLLGGGGYLALMQVRCPAPLWLRGGLPAQPV